MVKAWPALLCLALHVIGLPSCSYLNQSHSSCQPPNQWRQRAPTSQSEGEWGRSCLCYKRKCRFTFRTLIGAQVRSGLYKRVGSRCQTVSSRAPRDTEMHISRGETPNESGVGFYFYFHWRSCLQTVTDNPAVCTFKYAHMCYGPICKLVWRHRPSYEWREPGRTKCRLLAWPRMSYFAMRRPK